VFFVFFLFFTAFICTYIYEHIIQFHLYHSVNIYSDWLQEQFCNLSLSTLYILSVQYFFFFYCRYNPLWVLAVSVILLQSALSLHNFLHPLIPILCISSSTSSVHLFLGLPLILLPIGFHSNTLCVIHLFKKKSPVSQVGPQ
jgi:hypothetical protein